MTNSLHCDVSFQSDRAAWQLDFFAEASKHENVISATFGIRQHYYSAGRNLRLSPRLSIVLFPGSSISGSFGYTRNYQFTHRLYTENAVGSDIWILSTDDEKPGAADHINASFFYHGSCITAQLEGFLKWHQNLRRHETIIRPGSLPDGPVLLAPWTTNNEARAFGLESLITHRFRRTSITATYTLSQAQIRHSNFNGAEYFSADWDRPHQFSLYLQHNITPALAATLSWNIASGQTNGLSNIHPSEPARNPTYRRIDLALQFHRAFSSLALEASFRIYNLLDTRNVWYRTYETVLQGRGQNLRLSYDPVDVYDLGFQPSFVVSITF